VRRKPVRAGTSALNESDSRLGSRERRVRLPKLLSEDRRARARYAIPLDVRYTVQDPEALQAGRGRIADLSSSGLRFTADKPLPTGVKIELSLDWPLVLDGGVGLQLVALGVVVWTRGTETALQVERYDFRTRAAGLKAE
jgi:hypothetical protein